VVAAAQSSSGPPLRGDITCHDRGAALTDDDEPFLGEDRQGVLQGRHRNVLQVAHLADRGERLTCGEHPGADRVPDRVHHLLPGRLTAGGINGKERHVPVLTERLASARVIPAAPQLRVEQVEQRAAYLADLKVTKSGLDHPPDIDLVRLPGGQVPVSHLDVPVHELGRGGVCLGLASRCGLLEQLAELDLRRPFGLAGLPQPNLAARQRIGPGVHLHAPGSAGESLYVSGQSPDYDTTVHRTTDIGPQTGPQEGLLKVCFPWWGARGSNPEPMG
jgi:hypothetical protein